MAAAAGRAGRLPEVASTAKVHQLLNSPVDSTHGLSCSWASLAATHGAAQPAILRVYSIPDGHWIAQSCRRWAYLNKEVAILQQQWPYSCAEGRSDCTACIKPKHPLVGVDCIKDSYWLPAATEATSEPSFA
jgi:hypothetical protein